MTLRDIKELVKHNRVRIIVIGESFLSPIAKHYHFNDIEMKDLLDSEVISLKSSNDCYGLCLDIVIDYYSRPQPVEPSEWER